MAERHRAFPSSRGYLFDLLVGNRSARIRRPVCTKEADLGVTSRGGFLKAKRNRDRETETAVSREDRMLSVLGHMVPCHNMPTKFPKGLLKCSSFEATHNKKLRRFDKVLLRFVFSSSLGGNV